jgi:hypothetical protein
VIETGKTSVLGFVRQHEEQDVMVLANFSPDAQKVDPRYLLEHGMTDTVTDKIGQQKVDTPKDEALKDEALKDGAQTSKVLKIRDGIELAPYQCMWLVPANREVPQPPATETAKALSPTAILEPPKIGVMEPQKGR